MNGRGDVGRERSTGFAMTGTLEDGYGDLSDGGWSTLAVIAGWREDVSDIVEGVAKESVEVVKAGRLLELSSDGLGG